MPPSRKEPPRFEYDPEEDQYFPVFKDLVFLLRRRVDDLRMTLRVAEIKDSKFELRKRSEAANLEHLRELHGRIVPVGRQRLGFKQAFQDIHSL